MRISNSASGIRPQNKVSSAKGSPVRIVKGVIVPITRDGGQLAPNKISASRVNQPPYNTNSASNLKIDS